MRRPQWNPNTIPAHQVTLYAKGKGVDSEFHHAVARALWETGADLGNLAVLKEIAEGCGLDWAELSPLLESEESRLSVFREYENAKAQGVSGTPTYMVGEEIRFGDLSVEDLRSMILNASSS